MKVVVNQVYTSVACNRMPEIADWNNEGLIGFGATNAVVVYDTNQKGKDSLTVLSHHRSKVNSVKWLRKEDGTCTELISCSADKTAAVWTMDASGWKVTGILTGHTEGVTCIHGVYVDDDLFVYTGSMDSTVRVWQRHNGTFNLKQSISLNSGLCLTLHAHLLPIVKKPVLFCALDDHKIHIYADEEYHKVHTLVGHEDWVRGLDVLDADSTTILLASASQDTYIRLWRIQQHVHQDTPGIKVEEKLFHAYKVPWSVKLEAVLAGHEGWVYGIQWHPYAVTETSNKSPVYRLLSSSLDKTLIIWEPESGHGSGDGAWAERVRVGEVGGNGLGFYGARFGPRGASFVGHGYNGSFHVWTLNKETEQWEPTVVCGGHFGEVEDVRWEPRRGRYLVSVSADQTTRLHAPWRTTDGGVEWHEIARPQVHGYDLASIAPVTGTTFASAAEEKVIRVFAAPHNFVQNFKGIVGETLVDDDSGLGPEGALVPSLGLSNKAVYAGDGSKKEENHDGYFVPVNLTEPPTEETLMQNTLWPEVQKLYGHGYEVYALDASPDGALLASACKATVAEHAAVLIWETSKWRQIQKLVSHQLTVTQLAFSPDSRQLLSVSRDRRWTLFQRQHGSNSFDVAACTDKTNGVHTRIIWCCGWAHDGSVFGTGSRDGKVCVWSKTAESSGTSLNQHALRTKPLQLQNASVTSLAFAPLATVRLLAVGLESGVIKIFNWDDAWTLLCEMDNSSAHHLTVRGLRFRPALANDDPDVLLASCGADHLVRIHSLHISRQ